MPFIQSLPSPLIRGMVTHRSLFGTIRTHHRGNGRRSRVNSPVGPGFYDYMSMTWHLSDPVWSSEGCSVITSGLITTLLRVRQRLPPLSSDSSRCFGAISSRFKNLRFPPRLSPLHFLLLSFALCHPSLIINLLFHLSCSRLLICSECLSCGFRK